MYVPYFITLENKENIDMNNKFIKNKFKVARSTSNASMFSNSQATDASY